jgi:hypothetical protein
MQLKTKTANEDRKSCLKVCHNVYTSHEQPWLPSAYFMMSSNWPAVGNVRKTLHLHVYMSQISKRFLKMQLRITSGIVPRAMERSIRHFLSGLAFFLH